MPGSQLGSIFSPVINQEGQPIAGASVAIAQQLATTAATAANGLATLTMASSPLTAGFVPGATIMVWGFTGVDVGFNVGQFTQGVGIVNGATIIAVTGSSIVYFAPAAPAVATSNGSVLQMGNAAIPAAGLATVYSDPDLTLEVSQPISTDGGGNWNVFVPAGYYWIQFYSPAITTTLRAVYVNGNGSGGGGGTGPQGPAGPPGPAGTISIGTVTNVGSIGPPTVTNVGTATNAILNFGLQQGQPGTSGGGPGTGGPLNIVQHYFASPLYVSPAAPNNLSTGQGPAAITAVTTPELCCAYNFIFTSSLSGNEITASIYRTTSGIPAANQPVGGSDMRVAILYPAQVAAGSLTALAGCIFDTTGASTGVAYQYYLALTGTEGTIQIHSASFLQVAEV